MRAKPRTVLAGVLLAALAFAISVAAPRHTEGTVAAAVQVVNPYVPAEVENSSRTPYYFFGVPAAGNEVVLANAIPAGKRLVIDFVSGFCFATPSDSPAIVGIGAGTLSTNVHYEHSFTSQYLTNNLGSNAYAFSQQTHLYVEPGESFWVLSALHDSGSHCDVTVTGFLVNV